MKTNIKLTSASSQGGASELFNRLSYQLTAITSVAVTVGLVLMVLFYSERQQSSILVNNERAMQKVTESVIKSLQSVMIAGYADIAEVYADNLKTVPGVADFRILRINGLEAFRDNQTIAEVNEYRGDDDFDYRDQETENRILDQQDPRLQQVLATEEVVSFYESGGLSEEFLTFLAPIRMAERCDKCHDEDQPIRGLLKLTTSLAAVNEDLRQTKIDSIKILVIALVVIIGVTLLLVRHSVTRPIDKVSEAMVGVSSNQVHQSVPVLGNDELAQMAGSFNSMTQALSHSYHELENEQNKLATIILTASEGIIATNANGQVVLVNPALLTILNKPQQQLEEQGLTWLLDDPGLMNQWLEQAKQGHQSHVVEYHSKLLNVVVASITDEQGDLIGSTAFVRDVTTEKQLEAELRRLSVTDGLTGLYNRRYFDEVVRHEIQRAELPDSAMSLLLFDIDHFKQFNDNHGHDQGDRVLQQVAKTLQRCVRNVDIPCRYGGEEFVVILPNTDVPGARILADRIRKAIAQAEVDGLKVTVSIGVAHLLDYPDYDPDQLLEAADKAMYQAKAEGRNRVVVSQPDIGREAD